MFYFIIIKSQIFFINNINIIIIYQENNIIKFDKIIYISNYNIKKLFKKLFYKNNISFIIYINIIIFFNKIKIQKFLNKKIF